MDSLLKLTPMMLRLSGDNEEVREQAVFAAWRIVAGEGVAGGCTPFRLYNRHLVVAVLDQTWKKQLERISGEYLFGINSKLGGAFVTFIEFRIDRRFVKKHVPPDVEEFNFQETAKYTEELKPAAENIKNEDLRDKFLRAAAKYLERNKI